MKELLLGVDIGTTGTKSMVIDKDGRVLATAYKGYNTYNEKISWAEQDACDWWNAVIDTVKECTNDDNIRHSISAIGLSSQGGSMVPVDKNGLPLRRAITWMDQRGSKQSSRFTKDLDKDYIYNASGWKLGNGLNAVQIMWVKENEPEIFEKTYKFLSAIDFISYKLTGEYYIDTSSAGITQLINLRAMKWDKDILDLIGIDEERLPEIVDSGVKIGQLNKEASQQLGLSLDVPVVSGGHDQYCVALGAGAVNNGDILLATGTAWVVLGIFDKPNFDTKKYLAQSTHTVKGKWGSIGTLGTGGMSLEWYRKSLGKRVELKGTNTIQLESYKEIDKMTRQRSLGSNGILFYPHFNGSGYPTWAAANKGTLLGLDLSHDRYDIARAIMEGVAFEANWMLQEMMSSSTQINKLKMLGGASKSKFWSQMVADITGMPIILPKAVDIACIGAAILGGMGVGIFSDAKHGYDSLIEEETEILPNKKNMKEYMVIFQKYKEKLHFITESYKV